MKRQKVEALIAERLVAKEAAKRGISVQTLLDAEVTSKVGLVTEQEIETFYQANKARLQGEEATVREQIRTQLQTQKLGGGPRIKTRSSFRHVLSLVGPDGCRL